MELTTTAEPKKAHNAGEQEGLQACAGAILTLLPFRVRCKAVPDDHAVQETGKKAAPSQKVHFIRHGEGHHNVAQREWRDRPDWDGTSEPYTLDSDGDWKFIDALLTEKGMGQARDLHSRTEALRPELLVTSPMRRALQTGLLAFEPHVSNDGLKVLAHELCHERAGKHTCDKRLPKADLASLFPAVDFEILDSEEDPFWGDGSTREDLPSLANRAARFLEWLVSRPERHLAVAAHSAFLLALFNAAMECDCEATRSHFATGEMRTVLLTTYSE